MIAAKNVSKHYDDVVAVDGISFQIDRGEVVGFLGPNGAGKTTTMRMFTGTLQPDTGQVLFDGEPIAGDLTAAKARVGYMPESNALYGEMLVSEYLAFACELRGIQPMDRRPALAHAVEQTGIQQVYNRPIAQLSKGFRQRVGLAAAILHRPDVLILDEPTEGLDPNQRVGIRQLVRELGRDRTVLLSSHVLSEVEATCDRLLIISRGRLVADGSVGELLNRQQGGSQYTVEVEGDGPEITVVPTLAELPGVTSHESETVEGRARVTLVTAGDTELRPDIFRLASERGWTLWELHRERASLEGLFRQLTDEPTDLAEAGAEATSEPESDREEVPA